MYNQIFVVGNIKIFDVIRNEIKVVDEHLMSIKYVDELELEKLESLRMILEILDGFYKSCDSWKCCQAKSSSFASAVRFEKSVLWGWGIISPTSKVVQEYTARHFG